MYQMLSKTCLMIKQMQFQSYNYKQDIEILLDLSHVYVYNIQLKIFKFGIHFTFQHFKCKQTKA